MLTADPKRGGSRRMARRAGEPFGRRTASSHPPRDARGRAPRSDQPGRADNGTVNSTVAGAPVPIVTIR